MPKTQDDTTQADSAVVAPVKDVASMTVAELKAALDAMRKAEKEKAAQAKALPRYAYVVIMADSSLVYWSGAAESEQVATDAALAYARKDGATVYEYDGKPSLTPRPVPAPKGRKPGSTLAKD